MKRGVVRSSTQCFVAPQHVSRNIIPVIFHGIHGLFRPARRETPHDQGVADDVSREPLNAIPRVYSSLLFGPFAANKTLAHAVCAWFRPVIKILTLILAIDCPILLRMLAGWPPLPSR